MDLGGYWNKKERLINRAIEGYLKAKKEVSEELLALMRYSVLAGGKRLRSLLVLAVAEMLGKDAHRFLPCACAIEMIHSSSLILDDLPCMDDALTRRGKPALHRVGGEANAILASYALLTEGIKLVIQNAERLKTSRAKISRIVKSISDAVGLKGISLGQFLDLKFRDRRYSLSDIEKIHYYKTASLFVSSIEIGAVLGGANARQIKALKEYARNLGFAFQIKDDLLGYEKKPRDLGKMALKGEMSPSYVVLSGKEITERKIRGLIKRACEYLGIFGNKAKILKELSCFIQTRGR